jgi:AcrR family transcriptional regulator
MSGEDPRWTRSRAVLIQAVTALVDAGETPTITDVVQRAGVSRPTFYQHFGDLPTALSNAALDRIEAQFADVVVPAGMEVDLDFSRKTITALLAHLAEHSVFYRAVLADSSARRFTASVIEFVANRILTVSPLWLNPDEDTTTVTNDRVTVLAAGLVWLITQWLKRIDDGAESTSKMADRLVALMDFFGSATDKPSRDGAASPVTNLSARDSSSARGDQKA